jgi:hypothetical protein
MNRFFTLLSTVLLAAVLCIFFVTCMKQETTSDKIPRLPDGSLKTNATIVNPDVRSCMCCGGYLLSIDNNKPIAGDYFIVYDFPGGYVPTSYPMKVYIEWEKDPNACINDKIIIKKIVLPN